MAATFHQSHRFKREEKPLQRKDRNGAYLLACSDRPNPLAVSALPVREAKCSEIRKPKAAFAFVIVAPNN
ncbi:MAG: hypothetical protein ACXWIU_03125 [Limisphaerales bacterium]